jgi:ribonuclease D
LHGWRREVFGEAALALKRGEIALSLRGRKLVIQTAGEDARRPLVATSRS